MSLKLERAARDAADRLAKSEAASRAAVELVERELTVRACFGSMPVTREPRRGPSIFDGTTSRALKVYSGLQLKGKRCWCSEQSRRNGGRQNRCGRLRKWNRGGKSGKRNWGIKCGGCS